MLRSWDVLSSHIGFDRSAANIPWKQYESFRSWAFTIELQQQQIHFCYSRPPTGKVNFSFTKESVVSSAQLQKSERQKTSQISNLSITYTTRCLKITEKVPFNFTSEASYIYILSLQLFIKNAKKWSIWRVFEKPKACGQTVLPDRSVLIGQKLVENAKIKKI